VGGEGQLTAGDADRPATMVLVGVSGGVAAYKACELVRLLVRAGVDARVALTPDAERFVAPGQLAALSRGPVLRDSAPLDGSYPHLEAARAARVFCIAPCTANTLAKLALGLADNVVTQSALSTAGRLVLAPAMNVRMWHHPATAANLERLVARGALVVGPDEGELGEGESGMGRMAEPEAIAALVLAAARVEPTLAGRTVLVTAGGTREPLDGVRFLGNRSSGRMGVALAEEAAARGAEVVTLLANAVARPSAGTVVEVGTAEELAREALARARWADVVLMAAAVADFRPASPLAGKRERDAGWTLELVPTEDVLAQLAARRREGQVLVGFAAESGEALERARTKRERKGVDLIVLNDVSRADIGFDVADNEVTLVAADGEQAVPKASKREVAAAVLDRVESLLDGPARGA
jgi:phosphopantothenoylcysteine decarboxylase/phosphopantothenate--cysteine ligase